MAFERRIPYWSRDEYNDNYDIRFHNVSLHDLTNGQLYFCISSLINKKKRFHKEYIAYALKPNEQESYVV